MATQIVTKQTKQKVIVNQKKVHELLGAPKYKHAKGENKNEVGVTCGLAWTQVGGELLMTEVSVMKGSGQLQLTGKLGEVMKESAQAAQSFVRTRANLLGIYSQVFKDMDVHIHVPEGAVPKDGPSAGVTITTSLVSALTGIPVLKDVAMTGEITLRGKVLPIGGLKEKLLAAKRAQMKTVLIPHENLKDLEEVPDEITNGLVILPMKHVDEVLKNALSRFTEPVCDPLEQEKDESENNEVINQDELSTANPALPS